MAVILFHSSVRSINDLDVPFSDIVLVGHHVGNDDFMKSNKIKNFSMKEISFEGMHSVCDSVMAAAKDFPALKVIVSSKVLDKAFNSSSPPGGLTTRELIYFLQRIRLLRNITSSEVLDCSDDALRSKLESVLAKPL